MSYHRAFPRVLAALWIGTGLCLSACSDDAGPEDTPVAVAGQAGEPASGEGIGGLVGAGGDGSTPECPLNIVSAEGTSCSAFGDGAICTNGTSTKCGGGDVIVCTNGIWERRQALAIPC